MSGDADSFSGSRREETSLLTTDFVPGALCWIDLGSPDVVAATEFYGCVLGWSHVPLGPESGGYGLSRDERSPRSSR